MLYFVHHVVGVQLTCGMVSGCCGCSGGLSSVHSTHILPWYRPSLSDEGQNAFAKLYRGFFAYRWQAPVAGSSTS